MRNRLLKAIREAFPDARVAEYFSEQKGSWGIILIRNGMYTAFMPDEAIWNAPFKESIAEDIIEQIKNIQQYEVDPFYNEEEKEEGSNSV